MSVRPVDAFPYAILVVLMAYVADSFGWAPHRCGAPEPDG